MEQNVLYERMAQKAIQKYRSFAMFLLPDADYTPDDAKPREPFH